MLLTLAILENIFILEITKPSNNYKKRRRLFNSCREQIGEDADRTGYHKHLGHFQFWKAGKTVKIKPQGAQ